MIIVARYMPLMSALHCAFVHKKNDHTKQSHVHGMWIEKSGEENVGISSTQKKTNERRKKNLFTSFPYQ